MFTGIVEEIGRVTSIEQRGENRRITIAAANTPRELKPGDSVAVSGVCLTALDIKPRSSVARPSEVGSFCADLAPETWVRTSFSRIHEGALVNLELPMKSDGRFGGHIVQGHVDGCGQLLALDPVIPANDPAFDPHTTDWTLKVRVPASVRHWIVPKGSVAIEGISLTIAAVDADTISIAILPLTYWRSNLHALAPGAPVNVEADVLVKLAWQQMQAQSKSEAKSGFELTEPWLVANGY